MTVTRDNRLTLNTSRQATVAPIGMGYVACRWRCPARPAPTAAGFDIDPEKTASPTAASPTSSTSASRVANCRATQRFSATTDFFRLAACDAIPICVPTPGSPP